MTRRTRARLPSVSRKAMTNTKAPGTLDMFLAATGTVTNVDFAGVDFRPEALPKDAVYPSECTFQNCDFSRANFKDAQLGGLTFDACTFQRTTLTRANLHTTTFQNIHTFSDCIFDQVDAEGVQFLNCDLSEQSFERAILREADFTGTTLKDTNFNDAILTDVTGFVGDHTRLRGAGLITKKPEGILNILLRHNEDPWSGLRSRYTGLRMIMAVLPALIYVIILFCKALLIVAATVLAQEDPAAHIRAFMTCTENCTATPLWKVIWTLDTSAAGRAFLVLAIIHNAGRFIATLKVDSLARAEDKSGYCPSRGQQKLPSQIDIALRFTGPIMLGLFAWTLINLALSPVPILPPG